jgi:hypothetical protein
MEWRPITRVLNMSGWVLDLRAIHATLHAPDC